MLKKDYPLHDMNIVFDMLEEVFSVGDAHEKSIEEMNFLNRLFAALPAEAVEYGMQFLHGNKELPKSCDSIMPLYIRFINLVEYAEKIESLRDIPKNITTAQIMERQEIMTSLDDHEKAFGMPLLGYKFGSESVPEEIPADSIKEDNQETEEGSSALHLMNSSASVFCCKDVLRTALFYEQKCGFKAIHLDDEKQPHIRLERDNIFIVLVLAAEGSASTKPVRELCSVKYDMYIYVTEPLLLYSELSSAGVKIIEQLEDAQKAVTSDTNRQFVFEDPDGRWICCSQETLLT